MASSTVYDFNDLRTAILDPSVDEIYLGNSINFSGSSGVVIPKTKPSLLLDGQGFTITDFNSHTREMSLYYDGTRAPTPITFTLQNVVWTGRNWYGMIPVYEVVNNDNVTLVHKNVTYTGPQSIHNRWGITQVEDSSFSIVRSGSFADVHEFAEANRVIFKGKVNIDSQSTTSPIFLFPNSNSSFTVEENAEVDVTTTFHFLQSASSANLQMTFKSNSKTNINTRYGIAYDVGATVHVAENFVLEGGASFKHTQSERRLSYLPSLKCNNFVAGPGSTFHLFMPSGGAAGGSNMYFGQSASINFNNPKSVVLYNIGQNVFSFAVANNNLQLSAELVNRWSMAGTGGFDDTPTAAFAKKGETDVTANVNMTRTAMTSVTSNITSDDKGNPMDNTRFNLFATQVLAMGTIDFTLEDISDISTYIEGQTETNPPAKLRAKYDGTQLDGVAEGDGNIKLAIPSPIAPGTKLDFGINWNFLTKFKTVYTIGSLRITYLPDLDFRYFMVPYNDDIVKRIDPAWYMEVTDTRLDGGDWYLYTALPLPMTTGTSDLTDALTFNEGASTNIVNNTPVLVKIGTWSDPPKVTRLTWPELEGFLLKVVPNYPYNAGHYVGTLKWEIKDEPMP